MGPVEQREAHLDVAQPSLLAGPRSTGDEPEAVRPASGQGRIDQTVRHHVLPPGRRRSDPGTPAHQVGPGPLKDDYVVAGPMQERRCHAPGDRPPTMPTLIPVAPGPPRSATPGGDGGSSA